VSERKNLLKGAGEKKEPSSLAHDTERKIAIREGKGLDCFKFFCRQGKKKKEEIVNLLSTAVGGVRTEEKKESA